MTIYILQIADNTNTGQDPDKKMGKFLFLKLRTDGTVNPNLTLIITGV